MAELLSLHHRQQRDIERDDFKKRVVAACSETLDHGLGAFEATTPASIALGDAGPQRRRDRWTTIDTILDTVGGRVPDRPASHSPGTITIGMLSGIDPCPPNARPRQGFVAALALAVNAALSGSPQRLERFLPSDPTIEQLLQARGAANEMPRDPARLYLQFLYSAILTRAVTRETPKSPVSQRQYPPLPKWRLARVKEYIDRHMEEPIRLTELAKVVGLSRMHFAAQFRARVGMSPREFVMMRRMEHAQNLLRDPRSTVVDVALSVGFQTQSHFTTMFHRYVGNTPHRWRAELPPDDNKVNPRDNRLSSG